MNTTYPLDSIITLIISEKNINKEQVTCDDIKEYLARTDDQGTRLYNISYKEDLDNDMILFYYNEQHENIVNTPQTNSTENACKSCIYVRSTLQYICSQYDRIVYNEDTLKLLNSELDNAIVQKCYEGTTLLVFNHNGKWFISTRKCIDASSSTWVRNQSYKDLFEEAIGISKNNTGKPKSIANTKDSKDLDFYNILDPNFAYIFILVHYKNKNIVNYNQPFKYQNRFYKQLYLCNVTIKCTYDEITRNNYMIPNIPWTEEVYFPSVAALLEKLAEHNIQDITNKNISTEGYVLKIYKNNDKQGKFIIGKLQTDIYKYIMFYKPNVQNIYQIFLEFYKKDKLTELLPYFKKGKNNIILKIHNSMKILTKEMLELYHTTRNKKNEELYNQMPKIYKKVLYDLHGIYIKNKKLEQNENDNEISNEKQNKSINIHDVYNFLKELPLKQLVKIFKEREKLVENPKIKCLNDKDNDIEIYTKFMLD